MAVSGMLPSQQILAGVASDHTRRGDRRVYHYNIDPVIDIYGSVDGRDLGGVLERHQQSHRRDEDGSAAGFTDWLIRGQIQTMTASFKLASLSDWLFDNARLLPYRCEFPVLAGSFHHLDGPSGGSRRASCGCFSSPAPPISVPALYRVDHVHGSGHRQQHPDGELR